VCATFGQLEQRIQKKKYVVDCRARSAAEIRKYTESIFDILRGPFLILDSSLHVLTANQAFYQVFSLSPEEAEGNLIYHLGRREWNIPELRELLEGILPQYGTVADFELEHCFQTLGVRKMVVNAREVHIDGRHGALTVLSLEDVTDQRVVQQQLRSVHHDLEARTRESNGELRRALEYLTKEMIERKRAEDEARESGNYFKLLLKSFGEDIIVIDPDYRITDVANETLATSGFSRDHIVGKPCFEALHGLDGPCERSGASCPLPKRC